MLIDVWAVSLYPPGGKKSDAWKTDVIISSLSDFDIEAAKKKLH